MGEIVEKRMEAFAPALLQIKQSNIFTEEEINKLVNKIHHHESKMVSGKQCLEDYKAAIKYEEGVYMELRRRKKAKHGLQKSNHLDWIFIKRIMATYRRGLKNFTTDYNFNLAFFEFLKFFPEQHQHVARDHVNKMIQVFQHEPDVFRQTAAWYFQCGKNDEARHILLRGQSLHPKNLSIYIDLIEIELKNTTEIGIENRLKKYIDTIMKNNISYRFLEEIIKIFEGIENLKKTIDYIIEQLLIKYRDEPGVWKLIASREMRGNYYPSGDEDKRSTIYSIERAILRFREGISILSPDKLPHLWKEYLNMMIDLQKDYKSPQTVSFLRDALEEAGRAKIDISESHYLAWIDCCSNNNTLLVQKIEEGTKKHPTSALIWSIYLKLYICQDNPEFAKKVFEKAIIAVGPQSLKIWECYIDFIMLRSPTADVDALYEAAIKQPHEEITKVLKPRYLVWMISTRGIKAGRSLYLRIANQPPYCKKLHWEMLVADKQHDIKVVSTAFQKQILELWMQQLGVDDVEVHLQRIEHVKALGGPDVTERVREVYDEAIRTLSDDTKVALFKKLLDKMD
ncbi:unnamed protein product [Ceutorhynchus assimilis]|uniref:U3 small nucleolar RNA-associated protein 6 N-terminal domain-containing protein n=1 Tax=Ceutorhynchus assimilis TaxID=467358 RepID=A0A9N9MTZ5_9CUCU|nr:unnamed protein product [Ceutorhynchus assimilis]